MKNLRILSTMSVFLIFLILTCCELTPQYTLQVTIQGEGSVHPPSGTYKSGEVVSLTAAPESGWKFNYWSGDASGTTATTTVVMDKNKVVIANFTELTTFPITITTEGQGEVHEQLLPKGKGTYTSGDQVQLEALPAPGWQFVEWKGDLQATTNPITIEVTKPYTITAVFTVIPTAEWNFLVYLDADNNLEAAGMLDFNEMERIGSTTNVNILVLIDRSPGFDTSNGNWSGTRLYKIQKDTADSSYIISELLEDYGELRMDDPNTLVDFIEYCQVNYPAERTVLTMWDHGDGVYPKTQLANPIYSSSQPANDVYHRTQFAKKVAQVTRPANRTYSKTELANQRHSTVIRPGSDDSEQFTPQGICWDDTSGTGAWDCLTTDEVAWALATARSKTGQKIDLFNLDACLMQMLEVAYEWRDETDYIVGSEETVLGYGNDYDAVLSVLTTNPSITPRTLALTLVDEYYNYYNTNGSGKETYSAISLDSDFQTLINSFQTFATAMKNTTDLERVHQAWQNTVYFTNDENNDLGSLLDNLLQTCTDQTVKNAATNLKQALQQAVFYHKETADYAGLVSGLAICLPTYEQWSNYALPQQYQSLRLSQDTDWDEFILRFVNYTKSFN